MQFEGTNKERETGKEIGNAGFENLHEGIDPAVLSIAMRTQLELQENHFDLWFMSKVQSGLPRKSYKVPFKILSMPCGCERNNEQGSNSKNAWHVKRKKGPKKTSKYCHKECGGELN